MSDLTREEVDSWQDVSGSFHWRLTEERYYRLKDSWLTLEARVRELEGTVERYSKYLKWQGELHVDDRGEVHELRAEIERINGLLENREEETQG